MSSAETLLIFGGIPLAVILIVTALAFAASARSAPRYRPGRPFIFTPVWYLAEAPPGEADHRPDPIKALPPGRGAGTPAVVRERGGARGSW